MPFQQLQTVLCFVCILLVMNANAQAQLVATGPQESTAPNTLDNHYTQQSSDTFTTSVAQQSYTTGKEQRYQDFLACIRNPDGSVPTSFADYLINMDVAGTTIAILEGGFLDRIEYFGLEDVESGEVTDTETIYNVASMSKFMAGIVIAEAHRQGIVGLNRSIRSHASELGDPLLNLWLAYKFTGTAATYPDTIKLKHLLSHSAGLDTSAVGTYAAGHEKSHADFLIGETSQDWVVDTVGVLPVLQPRTTASYSGGGYVAAEVILEAASGSTYADWTTANLLQPLGMSASTYEKAVTGMPHLATRCGWSDLLTAGTCQNEGSLIKSATGFLSRPADWATLLEIVNAGGYDRNGALVLDPEVIEDVLTPAHHEDSSLAACAVDSDCANSSEICFLGKCKQPLASPVTGTEQFYGLVSRSARSA